MVKLGMLRSSRQITEVLVRWFLKNARDLPWRRTLDPYAIWISEIMLQQTQVKTVIPYFERWMAAFPDFKSLAKASEVKVIKAWEGLGYYSRARNAHSAAKTVARSAGGQFPTEFDDVLALPGIGPYTAGAICSIAFNQPTPILDGNVARVLSRLFAIRQGRTVLWKLASELVSNAARLKWHQENSTMEIAGPCSALNQSLMELGALICTPRAPKCNTCPVRKNCAAYAQGRPEAFPRAAKRPNSMRQDFVVLVFERNKCYLVRRRAKDEVNGGFWEFPNVEIIAEPTAISKVLKRCPVPPEPLGRFNHSIMNRRIRLEAFIVRNVQPQPKLSGEWLSMKALKRLPIAGAHRKILRRLQVAAR